jgi:hypothetical protein
MNPRSLCLVLIGALTQLSLAAAPPVPEPAISQERLARVFLLLTNAHLVATSGILPPEADTLRAAEEFPLPALKKQCLNLVDACLAVLPSVPREQRPDMLGYMKNAKLRLIYNREDSHAGHTGWAHGAGPQKTNNATRELANEIKKSLVKL